MGNRLLEKSWFSTAVLLILLVVLSTCSLFVGVTDIDLSTLLHDREGMETKIFLLARVPRLLAILCTGMGMSVAGLIMQQLCMNKFVSPSTGATIQSAQFGILLSLVFFRHRTVGQGADGLCHGHSWNLGLRLVYPADSV